MACGNLFAPWFLLDSTALKLLNATSIYRWRAQKGNTHGDKIGQEKAALSSGFQETSAALRARFGKIAALEREDSANAYSE
jgi:hypothetical protein